MKPRLLILLSVLAVELFALWAIWHATVSNSAFKAATIELGMSPDQVRQIMGEPEAKTSHQLTFHGDSFEEWHYKGPAKLRPKLSLRPLRLSIFARESIEVEFTDNKVAFVSIPQLD